MSPTGWLLLGAAVAVLGPRAATDGRLVVLAGAGRLAPLRAEPDPNRRRVAPAGAAAGAIGAAVLAVLLAGGAVLAAAAGAAAAAGWVLIKDGAVRRRELVGQRDLATGLRVLIGELAAGARPAAALVAARDAAPLHAEAFDAAASASVGSGDAAAELLARPETRPIGLAWQLGADTGIALAAVLDRVAADLRADQEHRRSVEAILAGPRASALLLAGLPVVGICLGAAMGARPLHVLTATIAGQLLCLAGVLLDVAGLMWMRRLLHGAERA
jgi:tight adherence protein B